MELEGVRLVETLLTPEASELSVAAVVEHLEGRWLVSEEVQFVLGD